MNTICYLDTSALNFFVDNIYFKNKLFSDIKEFVGIDICISEVTIWEVMLNSNKERKESLVAWAQFNCSNYLLKSPAELFVMYLENDCPRNDKKQFWFDRKTSLDIGATWEDIHGCIDKTFQMDDFSYLNLKAETSYIWELPQLIKSIDGLINENISCGHFPEIRKAFKKLTSKLNFKPKSENLTKISFLFVLIFVCNTTGSICKQPINDYWEKKKISDLFDRLDWLIENAVSIFTRGPIVEMALIAQSQFPGSFNRGVLFDSLHSVYCYYADHFISNDKDFKVYKKILKPPVSEGIILCEDLKSIYLDAMKEFRRTEGN